MPKVSVIVPVFNTEKYLTKCFDSLINQTLKDLEVNCVNDASTDGSLATLKDFAQRDSRIKLIDFTEHKGVSRARNAALEMATGEYVGFVDSDDCVDLDFYEKLYNKARQTGADIVKGDLKECFPNGEVKTYQNILKNKLCFYLSFTSAIYRLSLIKEKRCFFDHRLIHSEDLVWLNKVVIVANKVETVSDVCYFYLRRNDSANAQILSGKSVSSAYIGMKHIFLKTRQFEQTSDLDFSACYQNDWEAVLSFIFRTPDPKDKAVFCRLLLFLS